MEAPTSPQTPDQAGRKRSKSSVFKAWVAPKNRTPSPTKVNVSGPQSNPQYIRPGCGRLFQLPPDHPCAKTEVLSEIHQNSAYDLTTQNQSAAKFTPPRPVLNSGKRRLESSQHVNRPAESPIRRKLQLFAPKDKENTTPPRTATQSINTVKPSSPAILSTRSRGWFVKDSIKKIDTPTRPYEAPYVDVIETVPTPVLDQSLKRCPPLTAPTVGSGIGSDHSSRHRLHGLHETKGKEAVEEHREERSKSQANKQERDRGASRDGGEQLSELDIALEAVLEARHISENQRRHVRSLDSKVKADLIRHNQAELARQEQRLQSGSISSGSDRSKSPSIERGRTNGRRNEQSDESQELAGLKKGRSRSRVKNFMGGDRSQPKNPRSLSRPRSLMSLKNFSSSSLHSLGLDGVKESKEQEQQQSQLRNPDEFIDYLRETRDPRLVEVGKIHKLQLLTRDESVTWISLFISNGGMIELLGLLKRIMNIEWREEHEDVLLKEVLLCLKGLCTTGLGRRELAGVESNLFPDLLNMLFDQERKGPSEYSTRGVAIYLMFVHLAAAGIEEEADVSKRLLRYLSDPGPTEDSAPVEFIRHMRRPRPYQLWCKEITNVTKETFWIFSHGGNEITLKEEDQMIDNKSYTTRHFPKPWAPVATAPHIGGVEWEATNYLATHLDLMNALIATRPTKEERKALREDLRASGFEKTMGKTLRTCKEKLYGAVHGALRTWIVAATEDGWPVRDVQFGPVVDATTPRSPTKSPSKGARMEDAPPKLELPKLDLGVGIALGHPKEDGSGKVANGTEWT